MGERADRNKQSQNWYSTVERQALTALSHGRRRLVLSVLDREGPMHPEALAAAVLAAEDDSDEEQADDAIERVHLELRHIHLPKLDAVGLVSWTDDTVEARLDEHGIIPDARTFVEADRQSAARHLQVLSTPPRRTVCTVLSEAAEPMDVGAVASGVQQRSREAESAYTDDSLRAALHHVHLPLLDQTGIIRYDHTVHVAELVSTPLEFNAST